MGWPFGQRSTNAHFGSRHGKNVRVRSPACTTARLPLLCRAVSEFWAQRPAGLMRGGAGCDACLCRGLVVAGVFGLGLRAVPVQRATPSLFEKGAHAGSPQAARRFAPPTDSTDDRAVHRKKKVPPGPRLRRYSGVKRVCPTSE